MIQAVLLAMIAGYADTVGYLRFEAFAGLMTGNTIFLGIEVAGGKWGAAGFHATIIAMFLIGVVTAQALARLGTPVWATLTGTALLLVLSGVVGKSAGALVLPLAMGLQNSAANRFNGVALNTVFITGNIQKVGEGLVAWAWPNPDAKAKADGFAIFGLVWFGYGCGAALGAIAEHAMAAPLVVPAFVLPFVMLPRTTADAMVGRMRRYLPFALK